jgi:hypothetical protein
MNATALQNVSQALKDRIEAAVDAEMGREEKVFVGPLDDEAAGKSQLVLFLYRLTVNPDLRNAERQPPTRQAVNDPAGVETPDPVTGALPLDLHYVLTVSPQTSSDTELNGLFYLGQAIQALNDQPILVGPEVGGEIVRVSLDSVSNEEMSRVWSLFPTVNYRTSVVFLATPVWIDPKAPLEGAKPVVNENYDATPIPARGEA